MPLSGVSSLSSRIEECAKLLDKHLSDGVLVIYHYDGDGIAGAAALCRVLLEREVSFIARAVQELDPETVEELSKMPQRTKVFVDIGSGYPDCVEKISRDGFALVVDHHQPLNTGRLRTYHEVNPHLDNLDGARAASGASLAAYLAYVLSEKVAVDTLRLGIIGSVSDMQLVGGKLVGFNEFVLKEAERCKVVRTRVDLVYALSGDKPIHKAIANTYNPFIPGLSGREDNVVALLTRVGIKLKDERGRWRTFSSLSDEEKDRLLAGIAEWILKGETSEVASHLFTTIFEFPGERRRELATAQSASELINATARMGAPNVGLRIAMGLNGEALSQALDLAAKRREQLAEVFNRLEQESRIKRMRAMVFVDGRDIIDERLVSSVATIFSTSPTNKGTYVVVATITPKGLAKISARVPKLGLTRPKNLGLALNKLASEFGGIGGGHSVAAGAKIPAEHLANFIEQLDSYLGDEM